MDGVIRRNKTMFGLSIIALVLYAILTLISAASHNFISEYEDIISFRSIINYVTSLVLWVGFITVYVLFTPDNEGNIRKRPTWQFVFLIVSVLVPMIQGILYNFADLEWGTTVIRITSQHSSGYTSRLISITDIFVPIRWVMLIILLIKCERKAKKIIISYIASSLLYVLYSITVIVLYKVGTRPELMEIYSILALAIVLVMLIFTIIYTRQKYKEACLLEEQRGL